MHLLVDIEKNLETGRSEGSHVVLIHLITLLTKIPIECFRN